MAVDTPMILPVPKVAANVVASAPKGETRWRGGFFSRNELGPGRGVGGYGSGFVFRRIRRFRAQGHTDGSADMPLGYVQMDGKVQMDAQEQEQQGPVP